MWHRVMWLEIYLDPVLCIYEREGDMISLCHTINVSFQTSVTIIWDRNNLAQR